MVALTELCDINVGRTPSRDNPAFWGIGAPWLSIADMNQGREILRTKEQITSEAARAGKLVEPGTVLLSFKLSIGKVAVTRIPLFTNEAIAALPIKTPDRLNPNYLAYALHAMDLATGANRAAMGATLNKAKLQQLLIPLPPLDEQRRIAAILDHADALRAKRRQVIAHLDDLAQSIFVDMFGDPDSRLTAGDSVRFGDIANLQGGRNLVADDEHSTSRFRVLKISAVTSGQFKADESKPLPIDYEPPTEHMVRQGDLLISRANTAELVGAVAYVDAAPINIALPDKIWRFVWKIPDSVPLYYWALFGMPSVRRRMSQLSSGTGGSMKNISKAKLAQLELPNIDVQRQSEFARCLEAIPRPSTSELDTLFASLQSRAFRGEL